MATADEHYVDPSALRAMYVHDARSAPFAAWRRRLAGPIVITRHGHAELENSIELAVFHARLVRDRADIALAAVAADVAQGSLAVVDVFWRRALDLTRELSREHTARLGVRTLDAMHVASALTLKRRVFVTYDERQAALARAVKLRVLAP